MKVMAIKDVSTVRQVLRNAKRSIKLFWSVDKKLFLGWMVIILVGSIIPLGLTYAFKLLVDALTGVHSTTGVLAFGLLGALALRSLLDILNDLQTATHRDWFGRVVRFKMEVYTTYCLTEKIAQLDVAHLENPEVQNLIRKGAGADWRLTVFIESIFYGCMYLFTLIGSFLLLIPYGSWVPMILILAAIPRFLLRNKLSRVEWWLSNLTTPEAKEMDYVINILHDPNDLKEIRVAQATGSLLQKISKIQKQLLKNIEKPLQNYLRSNFWLTLTEGLLFFSLAYSRVHLVTAGLITAGGFTFFLSLIDRVSGNVQSILGTTNTLYEHNLYLNHYFDIMSLEPVVKIKSPGIMLDGIAPPTIEFQNVSFTYPDGTPGIKNVSFTIKSGEHTAIVGPNGAGKSTIIKLLLRFYDVSSGQILIDGHDLRDLKLQNWYKFVSILFQDFAKFRLTIEDNITFGRTESDNDKIQEAAHQSGAAEFIENLPKKYKQRLGKRFEESVELSHGQWQKLALARVFYEAAPILILDEPTSAIDAEAEAEIFNNIYKLYRDKTLLLVSHRFSTIKRADHIIVLQRGKLTEEGSHESLMKKENTYARMFNVQAKGYLE